MHCKPGTYMVIQTKARMTSFLFKKIQKVNPRWYLSKQPLAINFRWTWFPCQLRGNKTSTTIWFKYAYFTLTHFPCHNCSFGLATKAKGLQGCEPKGSPGVTSHTPGSVRKCEGVNPHTPKATPTLGNGVTVDFQNFRERFERSKLNGLWRSLYHQKALGTQISKMGSYCSFGHLKHKLWPKEGPRVKLSV